MSVCVHELQRSDGASTLEYCLLNARHMSLEGMNVLSVPIWSFS